MRIWDVSAGYLNRGSLLSEHRELHGLRSILVHGKKGDSRHPETMRWSGCLSGLDRRHECLAAEMRLRGYVDRTPVDSQPKAVRWPGSYVTEPAEQIHLLQEKYIGEPEGRIPLPRRVPELWAHHKYSVLARDPAEYRRIGRRVSSMTAASDIVPLTKELVELLRVAPTHGRLANALDHMWGHVNSSAAPDEVSAARETPLRLLEMIVRIALRVREPYLTRSTALSELDVFLRAA